jgi:excisionase family DNA binding protein
MDDDVVTLVKLARELGVAATWLRKMAVDGKVPCVRAGKRFLFARSAVRKALATLAAEPVKGGGHVS